MNRRQVIGFSAVLIGSAAAFACSGKPIDEIPTTTSPSSPGGGGGDPCANGACGPKGGAANACSFRECLASGSTCGVASGCAGNGAAPGANARFDGVVQPNFCYPLLAGSSNTLTFKTAPTLPPNAALLVLQASAPFAAVGTPGPIAATGGAGAWDLVRASSQSGNVVTVSPLRNAYQTKDAALAEACVVPEYDDLEVAASAQVVAAPFNDFSAEAGASGAGGVVALLVKGTLRLDGAISAAGRGFKACTDGMYSSERHR
jgi:hypothetical protein